MDPGLMGLMTAGAPHGWQPGGENIPYWLAVIGPKEAAEYLRVPEQAVVEEAESGRLPGQKIGAQWRFLVLALAEWLRSGHRVKKELSPKEQILSAPVSDETPEEQEAFLQLLRAARKSWGTVGSDGGGR
jgi:excisionase family DNA binding protein